VAIIGLIDLRGRFVAYLSRIYMRIVLWISGVKYRVIGIENLDSNSHYIFTSNHESAFDIPLILGGLDFHIVFLAKKELKNIPILGWAMLAGRHIFIDRYNRKKAVISLRKARQSLSSNPRSLIIFPEGTRSKDGKIHQFKKGGLSIALDIGMDLVPLAVCGTGSVIAKNSFTLNKGEVELHIGKPVISKHWKDRSASELADHLRNEVLSMKKSWKESISSTV
tara:strand:- start:11826 stop:12494 length:669 start_codon:yes stop_codon:yes gene_type:complete